MNILDLPIISQSATPALGTVTGFTAAGACVVAMRDSGALMECEILQTTEKYPLCLVEGDTVMLYVFGSSRAVILGRLGPSAKAGELSDSLVIEANKSLTLQCGEGSITLRRDGRILIKGKEIVSRAEETNRIRGASVTIN